jgi:hypothetical protein
MAPGKPAADFNAIINAGMRFALHRRLKAVTNPITDRQRRKNEALAEEIFSKNRRSSAPGSGINNRKPGSGPSLASRIGISKVGQLLLLVDGPLMLLCSEPPRIRQGLRSGSP